jgi:DNA polymerase III delta prime subunit
MDTRQTGAMTLEEEIVELRLLDEHRSRAGARLGKLLKDVANHPYGSKSWEFSHTEDINEQALVLVTTLLAWRYGFEATGSVRAKRNELADSLADPFEPLFPHQRRRTKSEEKDQLSSRDESAPILAAAGRLRALTQIPGRAFTRGALGAYFTVIDELYTTESRSSRRGGARASNTGRQSAFMTDQCLRAIYSLARSLEAASGVFAELAVFEKDSLRTAAIERLRIGSVSPLEEWTAVERARRKATRDARLMALRGRSAVSCEGADSDDELRECVKSAEKDATLASEAVLTGIIGLGGARRSAEIRSQKIMSELKDYAQLEYEKGLDLGQSFEKVEALIEKVRSRTRRDAGALHRTAIKVILETALMAKRTEVILDFGDKDVQAAKCDADEKKIRIRQWRQLAALFAQGAEDVRRAGEPAVDFMRGELDRALTEAAFDDDRHCDGAELAFAAASLGTLRKNWGDERVRAAADMLARFLSRDGEVPASRPISALRRAFSLHVAPFEVTRAIAQVWENVPMPLRPETAAKLLNLFTVTERPGLCCVGYSWNKDQEVAEWWSTALAARALHAIIRMLDRQINRRVLNHFEWREGQRLEVDLDRLFYPDHGLSSPHRAGYEPLGRFLAGMYAHVIGDRSSSGYRSLLLHGPPGTGKTTLVEAVAKSSGVPLIQVTPSDLLTAGRERTEHRARVVFQALEMLSDAVILFDEFEPVLARRDVVTPAAPGDELFVLTPGMLPRLKGLHDRAKQQRLAFALATNHLMKIDRAARRPGRFDTTIAVVPPDRLAREGRLLHEAIIYGESCRKEAVVVCASRLREVVKAAADGPMAELAKPGRFTANEKARREGNAPDSIAYLCAESEGFVKIKAEQTFAEGLRAAWRSIGGRLCDFPSSMGLSESDLFEKVKVKAEEIGSLEVKEDIENGFRDWLEVCELERNSGRFAGDDPLELATTYDKREDEKIGRAQSARPRACDG